MRNKVLAENRNKSLRSEMDHDLLEVYRKLELELGWLKNVSNIEKSNLGAEISFVKMILYMSKKLHICLLALMFGGFYLSTLPGTWGNQIFLQRAVVSMSLQWESHCILVLFPHLVDWTRRITVKNIIQKIIIFRVSYSVSVCAGGKQK